MMTLRQLGTGAAIPAAAAWSLAELGEARGKQELFTRQSPRRQTPDALCGLPGGHSFGNTCAGTKERPGTWDDRNTTSGWMTS